MGSMRLAPRLVRLPAISVLDLDVREAVTLHARLLGLAFLDVGEVGAGLLIPRCASVHTFGMRFALDVLFLDASGLVVTACRDVGPRRVVFAPGASAALEVPAGARRLLPGPLLNLVGQGGEAADARAKRLGQP